MELVARKPMTLLGTRYEAGESVSFEGVNPATRRRLVEMRRVVPHVVDSSAGTQSQGKSKKRPRRKKVSNESTEG